jgi:cytochrome P450
MSSHMNNNPQCKWDPLSESIAQDQISGYDRLRHQCPVAHSERFHWSLFKHADVMRVLETPGSFSNVVSPHLSVPNGMDPPIHAAYRRMIDCYFSPARMDEFEPICREIAVKRVAALPVNGGIELMREFAELYAAEIQCGFLEWPAGLHEPLRRWSQKNFAATLACDRPAMAAIAHEFEGYVNTLLFERRHQKALTGDDVLSRLMQERVNGEPLTDEEIVSILRNWTVGELATIAAAVGILVHYLAVHLALQHQLRKQISLLPVAIDEILRIRAPLIASRRITTEPTEIGGQPMVAGDRLTLIWASANRDETVFGDPDEFRLDRDPATNLLYGAGIHVCPGAPLARMELRVILEELLKHSHTFTVTVGKELIMAVYPGSGFSSLPVSVYKKDQRDIA